MAHALFESLFEIGLYVAEIVLDFFQWTKSSKFEKPQEEANSSPVLKNKREGLKSRLLKVRSRRLQATAYQTSAPGSLMLFGEHAVLHKRKALVMAVDQRIHVSLMPRNDDKIIVDSNLEQYETTVSMLNANSNENPNPNANANANSAIPKTLSFVFTAITFFIKTLKNEYLNKGFTLKIDSDFSHTVGLGSSAAVVVAVLRALSKCYAQYNDYHDDNQSLSNIDLFKTAKEVIESVQGVGSGADVAASVFGGLVLYCTDPLLIQPLAVLPPIKVIYSGYKTPTVDVIQQVELRFKSKPLDLEFIYNDMEACTEKALMALQREDWMRVGQEMNAAQLLMKNLGVSDDVLDQKAQELCADPNIFGAKISGAGLGDCVIGIGETTNCFPGELAVLPSSQGVSDD